MGQTAATQRQGRALFFVAPGRVEIRPTPVPALGDNEVLVRTSFSGISAGTEMLAYRGQLDPDLPLDETLGALGGTFRYPFRYGYSCVGTVEESRSSVAEGAVVFAFQPHQDLFVAAAEDVVVLDGDAEREATLFPLLETAFQITLDAGPLSGEKVVVFGLGVVGALTSLLLRRAGVTVIAVDPLPWRRALVERLGDPDLEAVDPSGVHDELKRRGGERLGLVVEASGNPDALRASLELLGHEGTVLVASWYGGNDVPLPLGGAFHRRRLTITSTQVSTIPARLGDRWDRRRRRRAVVELLTELPLGWIASDTFPFEEAASAFAALDERAEGVMHAAIGYR